MPDPSESALPYPTQAQIMGWVRIKYPTNGWCPLIVEDEYARRYPYESQKSPTP